MPFPLQAAENHTHKPENEHDRKNRAAARTKPAIFGVPSLETARAIDDSDKAAGLQAAHFRCKARLHELEAQFEAKASEIRAAFVAECAEILGGTE